MQISKRHQRLVACVALCASALLADSAIGQVRGLNRFGHDEQKTPAVNVPPVDTSAATQAQQGVSTAREAEKKAEDDLTAVAAKLRADFNTSPEMTTASAELKSAKDAYDAASRPILEKVHNGDEYKAAKSAHEDDENKLTDLRANNGSPDTISTTAMDALNQSSTMNKLETYALEADPQAVAGKSKMSQASAKIAQLTAAFNASLTTNPQWASAKKALDDAKQGLETASAALRDANQKLAADRAAHNAAVAQQQRENQEHPNSTPNQPNQTANNTNNSNNN